jgi:two-component system, LytTR family, sensor kinase
MKHIASNIWKIPKRGGAVMLLFLAGLNLMAYINHGNEFYLNISGMVSESLAIILFALILNEGMIFLSKYFENQFSENYLSFKRFLLEFVTVLFLSISLITLIYLFPIIKYVLNFQLNELQLIKLRQVYIMALFFTAIIFAFRASYWSYQHLVQVSLAKERLHKEQMNEQFEHLKNQVNPHFLFNCLNALSSLIYMDKDKASQFVEELSRVYRYILDSRGKQLVEIKQELLFLESYIFLLKVRYRSSIEFETQLEGAGEDWFVPPLVTQVIIENAIKHNILTRESPLKITIRLSNGNLVGKNNIQSKEGADSTQGQGHSQWMDEYGKLSCQNLSFQVIDGDYYVNVPLYKGE